MFANWGPPKPSTKRRKGQWVGSPIKRLIGSRGGSRTNTDHTATTWSSSGSELKTLKNMITCTVHDVHVLFYFRILNHIHPYPSTSSINKEHHPDPRNPRAPLLGARPLAAQARKLMIRPRLRSTVSEAPTTCLFSSPSERDDHTKWGPLDS